LEVYVSDMTKQIVKRISIPQLGQDMLLIH